MELALVDQAGLELTEICLLLPPASQGLELKACVTTAQLEHVFDKLFSVPSR